MPDVMLSMYEAVEQAVAEQATGFPWVEALLAFLVSGAIAWAFVEMAKEWRRLARLKKRGMRLDLAIEGRVIERNGCHIERVEVRSASITSKSVAKARAYRWPWWTPLLFAISLLIGAVIGLLWGLWSDLEMGRGVLLGAAAGVLNGLVMKVWRGIGDKASDVLLGGAKRLINGGGGGDE